MRNYRMLAGDAEVTLQLFVRQSGEEIIYSPAVVAGVTTNAIDGGFLARDALDRMLAGTVLSARQDEKTGALTVRREPCPKLETTATRRPPSTRDAAAEEAVQLEKYNVNQAPPRGYTASETRPGPRVSTPIQDLPFTVNSLTSEFFEDFAIFEFNDTLTQIGGLTGLDVGGTFNLRGFTGTAQLRDGFYRAGRNGPSNVERIEVIKGPNAGIYGRTTPGGMVNMVSKQPQAAETEKLRLAFGDYQSHLATFEATGSIAKRTSYIFTLSRFSREFDVAYSTLRNDEAYLAVRHDFADGSRLQASAESFLQLRRAPPSAAPVVTNWYVRNPGMSPVPVAFGYAGELAKSNLVGPNSELNRSDVTFLLSYEKKFNESWSLRTAGQYFRVHRWYYNDSDPTTIYRYYSGPDATYPLSSPVTVDRSPWPLKSVLSETGGGFQSDVTAHYWLGRHAVENKTLLSVDFTDYYRYSPSWFWDFPVVNSTQPDLAAWNAVRTIRLAPNLIPVGPIQYFSKPFEWGHESPVYRSRQRTTVAGGQIRQESRWLDGRLFGYAGARFDAVRFRGFSQQVGPTALIHRSESQLRPNFGTLYQLTKNLRIYANRSESYFVNQTTGVEFVATPEYKPETARGYDFGFKGSFLNERLSFTIGGYYIERFNVPITDDNTGSPTLSQTTIVVQRSAGDQLDRGWEADVTWQVDREISAFLSFGHIHAIYTRYGTSEPMSVGRSVQNISPENGSVSVKYVPARGALRGFSANVGVTYVATTPTEAPGAGDTYYYNPFLPGAVRTYLSTSGQWNLKVPSFTLWNAGVHYEFKGPGRLNHTLSLNINNAFDREYLKVSKQWGDRRAVYLTYRIQFRPSP